MKKRKDLRHKQIQEYLYGMDKTLFPHSFEVAFADLKLYKIGGKFQF